jgi:hypothetical protein
MNITNNRCRTTGVLIVISLITYIIRRRRSEHHKYTSGSFTHISDSTQGSNVMSNLEVIDDGLRTVSIIDVDDSDDELVVIGEELDVIVSFHGK